MKLKSLTLVLASAIMLVGLSACGATQSASKSSGSKQSQTSTKDQKQANKSLLTQYELNLQTAIRLAYTPFSTLKGMENAQSLDAASLKTTVQQAEKANTDLKSRLSKISIPSQLPKDSKSKLKSALVDLQTSFDKMSASIKSVENVKTTKDLTAAMDNDDKAGNSAFTSFMNKANAVNKKVGLIDTDYTQELK